MPMDRGSLSKVINAGRSTAFNVYDIGRRIPADDPVGKLFRNKTLNEAMFFKILERNATQYNTVSTVQTLMYFPYNLANVYEGGDSILFDDPSFNRMLGVKTGADSKSEESQVDYVMDLEILEMIYSLPTLDPFLLKSKSEQLDLDDRIHQFYFNISEDDWKRIRDQHLGDAVDGGGGLADRGAARPGDQDGDIPGARIRQMACGHDRVQGRGLEGCVVMFGNDENGHQITLASFFSLSTSSATDPTMTPAWRLAGSSTLSVVRRGVTSTPRSSGVSSSMGFFFAFMMFGREA